MSLASGPSFTNTALLLLEGDLHEQQRQLAQAVAKIQKEIRELANSSHVDVLDHSSGNAHKEALFAGYSQTWARLRKVELALERISAGDFGLCIACGESIGLKRLKAIPWAVNCIECQQESERRVQ